MEPLVTPADLAELLRSTAAAVLTEHGLDAAVLPQAVTVERPRNPEHGDYASNLALQLGKKVGANPRELAQSAGRRAGAGPGRRLGRSGRFPLHRTPPPGGFGSGRHRRQRHRRRQNLRTLRCVGRAQGQPGIRLGEPHRTDPYRWHSLGRRRRRAGPVAVNPGRRRGTRIRLQRPRRADRPVHRLADRRGQRRTHAGRRLRGRLHRRHRRPGVAAGARCPEPCRSPSSARPSGASGST